jgi:hypothetical protein
MPYWYHAKAVIYSSLPRVRKGSGSNPPVPALTAMVTATAAANGKQQRSGTVQHTRTIRPDLGYVPPEKQTVEDQRSRAVTAANTAAMAVDNTRQVRTTVE